MRCLDTKVNGISYIIIVKNPSRMCRWDIISRNCLVHEKYFHGYGLLARLYTIDVNHCRTGVLHCVYNMN